jgi:hypothetical protein
MELYKKSDRFSKAPYCPCGKSNKDGKFVPFVINGSASSKFGYCHSCGKSFFPSGSNQKVNTIGKAAQDIRYIDKCIAIESFQNYSNNQLCRWMQKCFPDSAENILRNYWVGTGRNNSTLFWYLDFYGNVCNAKQITYNPDGHRDKNTIPFFLFKKENGYRICLFGEHLINFRNSYETLTLVESEKTAIVGSILFPQYIWLATGGANGLTTEKARILKDRNVIILPDCDNGGRTSIEKSVKILESYNCNVKVCDLAPYLNNGQDVVDLIIESNNNY